MIIALFEKKMIYFPIKYPEGFWNPERYGVKVEDSFFTTEDGLRLHGWFAPSKNASLTLLWAHGNAGNITHRLENTRLLLNLDINVFIFDYRGYGKSEGEPDEEGLYRDARAAYDYLLSRKDVNPQEIVFFGRSIGTAVIVDLALHRQCKGMILESAFTSGKEMAKEMLPFFLPAYFIIHSKFASIEKIERLHVPILFTHGTNDHTVPLKLGRKLFDGANGPKYFYEIQGADHNDTYIVGGKPYFNRINEFLNTLKPTQSP